MKQTQEGEECPLVQRGERSVQLFMPPIYVHFLQAALNGSNEVMSSPLPRVHDQGAAGGDVETIGGPDFKAAEVAKVCHSYV